jgi:CheY-like chemotaxis protein
MQRMSKILLVEDDTTMRMLLKTLLELDGHEVSLVIDPRQDVPQTVHDQQPDLLIMDVHLRYNNGIDILKTIRQQASGNTPSRKPYILMTSGMNVQAECMQAGADGFLLKPYMPDELNRQLKRAQS